MSTLETQGLGKVYGDFVALAPTDITVEKGEFLTLLGPSGSGKTTLLSLIAGLSEADSGRILMNGQDVTYAAPYQRDIGMMFQNYALFPHMTIAENIAFPLKMRGTPSAEIKKLVQEALDMVRLPHIAERFPKELSGGQQQRVALARCTIYRPSVILMDEPLGALDKKLRDQMQFEILRIHKEIGGTIVYVTHDQEEAMTMSDRICLMNGGKIAQLGSPADLYFRPQSLFVADFLGEANLIDGRLASAGDGVVELRDGSRISVTLPAPLANGAAVKVMLRPQNLKLAEGEAPGQGVSARLASASVTGASTKLFFDAPALTAEPLIATRATALSASTLEPGRDYRLTFDARDAVAIAAAEAA
ncbi:MAG: ABC transporter ATP-binding protein [Paracoccus sp. (in: a-proteobacteria)]|uniref:ABC transporter ATP-binding protein n=1 Tax=Paracoccus sp. TaxID=267 RepID=UPI0039E660C9